MSKAEIMTSFSLLSRGTVAKHVAKQQSNKTHLGVCETSSAGCSNIGNMQAGEKRKTWDSSRFRRELITFWPRSHPVMFPHLQTDHWTKMKTMVPVYLASLPASLLKDAVYESREGKPTLHCPTSSSLLPPLAKTAANEPVPSVVRAYSAPKPSFSPQNMPHYRNVFNDRARRGFCYWLVEKKGSVGKGYSLGAYKTCLGLPRI